MKPLHAPAPSVLLVVPWDQEFGGVASVVGNLARYLRRQRRRVLFLHPGNPELPTRRTTKQGFDGYEMNLRPALIRGQPLRSVAAFLAMLVPTLVRLARLMRAERVEIVHVHYPLGSFCYFGWLRRLLGFRLVVTVHGADLFAGSEPSTRCPWSLRFLLRAADAIVAPSQAFLRDCVESFPELAPRARAIHNGIDLAELMAAAPHMAREPGDDLLCIAAHNAKKAIDVLLRAFSKLRPEHPELRLRLVGDGPLRGELETLARELGLGASVEFLGERGRAEVGRLLHGCRVFVLPSRAEPFGIVLAEALACGRPVVASAVGGIPEVIENRRTGLLVPPDDPDALARAIASVLEDETLRESLSAQGPARVRACFDSDSMGRRYERLYAELRGGRRGVEIVTDSPPEPRRERRRSP